MALSFRTYPSGALTELLARALIDQELRARLFADPETIAREFDVTAEETEAIKRLDRRKFERAAAQIRWG